MLTRRALLGSAAAAAIVRPAWAADTQDLIERAMAGIDPDRFIDVHTHVVGLGTGDSGCWVHPRNQEPWKHPTDWVRMKFYLNASGISEPERADSQYIEVLAKRRAQMGMGGHSLILAFDHVYDEQGKRQLEASVFHVPNDYVLGLAKKHPHMAAMVSVHPYRADAADEIHRCADAGAVGMKWLPNAQWIDPASPRCDAAYRAMADRGLVLLSHGGEEQAVHVADTQELGNPLRLRRALDKGVKVIVAHCAGYGHSQDLDAVNKPSTRANTLFLRMMDDPQYAGQLWGGLSATTLVNRVDTTLRAMLNRTDLHPRLIHGSDYPIPAVDVLINTWQLWGNKLLRWEDRKPLAKLFNDNPLLGEFVLKRVLVNVNGEATGFPPSVFMAPPGLFSGLS